MSSVVIAGNTSGTVTLNAPDIAGTTVLTLPTTSGTLVTTAGGSTVPFALGSAAAPSITFTGDTNTGIFSPGADTIGFAEGGTEVMRIDSSGNLNLTTGGSALQWTNASNNCYIAAGSGALQFATGTGGYVERMRIDSSGNVGIGTSSPSTFFAKLAVVGNTSITGGNNLILWDSSNSTNAYIGNPTASSSVLAAYTGSTERMRIDTNGNLLLGATSFAGGATIGFQINATNNTSGAYAQLIKNSSGTEIFQVRCDGGIGNFSANNANLSDERTKTNIELAGSYLEKICAIPVKTFKYKEQTDDLLNLGVIAQDVEAVAPELVDVGGFGDTPEDGIPLKAIYQTDLQYALMKCIQEQQAIINEQASTIAAFEARLVALENK